MKRKKVKQIKSIILILSIIALNVYTILGTNFKVDNETGQVNLETLITASQADLEGGYGNGYAGDCHQCAIWDSTCQCYVGGIEIWCVVAPVGYYCDPVQCGAGGFC